MATLQKIRTQGPLLVIVIGLALFAFIAGDAWKIFQPHQGKQDVGEINGEAISAQDYQKLVDEYSEIVKFTSGTSALTDEQLTQIKDEVWRSYVNNKLIENEAQKLGLTVSKAEIQDIINEGRNPILMQTPFRNQQTGAFDKDMLKKFLADYSKMDLSKMPAQYVEYYQSLYNFWTFVEKTLVQDRLAEKYQNLIAKSMLSNPVEAQNAFDARINQSDIQLAAVPYTSIIDSTITVSDSELKDLYNKKKEQYKQYVESRDIKFIDVQVTPSQEDRDAVHTEVAEYSTQLNGTTADYATFIRSTDSAVPFSDVLVSKTALPSDVIARIDSAAIGTVYGPYYNQMDDSYNTFKVIAKQAAPDSIQFRQIQVMAETEAKAATLADSIYNALKGGADFVEIANIYQQNGEPTWLTGANYEKAILDAENAKYINSLMNLGTKETANIKIGQGHVIAEVLDKKATKDKYKVAVVKRPVDFSKETYNKAYNDFSQFIATNGTLEKLAANAEDNGYRLLERKDFYSSEHAVGGLKGTREALKWVFEAKPGEVSQLYECGDSDHMLVVALSAVNKEGYRSMDAVKDQLTAEIRKDKKAEKIMADISAKNITNFSQVQSIPNAMTDTVKHVTFAAPTYVAMVRASEPVLGAYVSVAELNKVSAPVKGNAGVYVFQVYNTEKLNETFDAKKEEQTIENTNARMASRFINDLYKKAEVKDKRYLFF